MGATQTISNGSTGFLNGLSKKTLMIIGGVAVAVIIIVIVVPVEVTKENAYPSYTAVNYSLTDTYSGESFFDYFDYFTATVSSPTLISSLQCPH